MFQVCFLGPDFSGKSTLIPLVQELLQTRTDLTVGTCSSTKPVASQPASYEYRRQLVAEETSAYDRFHAAQHLYKMNLHEFKKNHVVDIVLIDRGFTSFYDFNIVDVYSICYQMSLIPKVDIAFYINSPWEDLELRAALRVSTDFQDVNLDFRKRVYTDGLQTFITEGVKLAESYVIANLCENGPSVAAKEIYRKIISSVDVRKTNRPNAV